MESFEQYQGRVEDIVNEFYDYPAGAWHPDQQQLYQMYDNGVTATDDIIEELEMRGMV